MVILMKKIKIHIKSADISEKRIKELEDAPFEKNVMSESELDVIGKDIVLQLFVGIAMIIAAIVLAIIFDTASSKLMGIIFIVLLIGGVMATLTSIIRFIAVFADIRSKTPREAIRAFFEVVMLGNGSFNSEYKFVPYAYGALRRMIPELISVDYEKFENYLEDFIKIIQQNAASGYREAFCESPLSALNGYKVLYEFSDEEKTASETHLSKTMATLVFAKEENDQKVGYAVFNITLELLLIKSGKFWFVADPMPEFTEIEENPATENEKDEVTQ
jgi:hypothetical protein